MQRVGREAGCFAMNSKLASFLFPKPTDLGQYAFLTLRLALAGFWLNSDVPRWAALAAGHPQANGLVRSLFGPSMVVPLTYFFTGLETLGAIALVLGLLTRLTSVWPVVEFAITGTVGLMGGIGALTKDYGLMAGALVLLANGSPLLSIDGLLAKKLNR
jgi:uncharacterized membrane protein YphA (DoxX/SURF4 family)